MPKDEIAERNATIVREVAEGASHTDLARRYGISRERVRQIANGVRARPSKPKSVRHYDPNSDDPIERRNAEIVRERLEGTASLYELADRYGISVERVRQISERGGVDTTKAAALYEERKRMQAIQEAEKHQDVIFMRYIAGHSTKSTAEALGLPISAVQVVLDENITDDAVAARYANHTRAIHPNATPGPLENKEPREDRYWTPERCWDALLKLARENGNLLPSSTQYQRIAPDRDDLPSFATIRNRLGRWTYVRAEVHRML